jgi:DHA1 family bicyclomycin/chloramphenicol resistance-like MFS transporter
VLPETHPPEYRVPFSARSLWRISVAMLGNRTFIMLTLIGTLNFGALFIYIASAPVFVMTHLGLNEQQFGWFFAPAVGGMAVGAFLSGRAAGRISPRRSASLGFALCLTATIAGVIYAASVEQVAFPWAVLPIALNSVGVALVFPIVTLAILDLYPRHRGAASSMQSFVSLLINAGVAGLISPLVSASALGLAATALGGCVIALLLWLAYLRQTRRRLPAPSAQDSAALEPTDQM